MTNQDPNAKNRPGSRPRFGAAQLRLLERLCTACAVSGDEGEVRAIVLEQVQEHVRSKGGEVKVELSGKRAGQPDGQPCARRTPKGDADCSHGRSGIYGYPGG